MVYARRYRRRRRFGRVVRRRGRKPWRRRRRQLFRRPRNRARSLRNGSVQRPSMYRLPMYLPDRTRVTMKYSEVHTYDPALAGNAQRVFRLSSIWDPDQTGTGNSASGYTLWSPHYRRYSVINATYIFQWVDNGGTQSYTMYAYVADGTTAALPGTTALVTAVRPGLKRVNVVPGTHNYQPSIRGKVPIKSWINMNWRERAAIMGQVPAAEHSVYVTVGVYPTDTQTDPAAIDMQMTIYYDVLLYELIQPTTAE